MTAHPIILFLVSVLYSSCIFYSTIGKTHNHINAYCIHRNPASYTESIDLTF